MVPFLIGGSMTNKIVINGVAYTPEELGIKRVVINGKRYLDVTPFWLDSKQSQLIDEKLHGARPKPNDFSKREMKG